MQAKANKTTNLNRAVTLQLSLPEALAIARFFGSFTTSVAEDFGVKTDERHPYNVLADALEYGDNAPLPIADYGQSTLYDELQKLPVVTCEARP